MSYIPTSLPTVNTVVPNLYNHCERPTMSLTTPTTQLVALVVNLPALLMIIEIMQLVTGSIPRAPAPAYTTTIGSFIG